MEKLLRDYLFDNLDIIMKSKIDQKFLLNFIKGGNNMNYIIEHKFKSDNEQEKKEKINNILARLIYKTSSRK